MARYIDLFTTYADGLWLGMQATVFLAFTSIVIALVIGLFTGLMALSRYALIRGIAGVYVAIIRGTPLLVQTFYVFFAIPSLIGFRLDVTTASILTLSLNAGAYMAEIFRGGIQAVDRGQTEAARSLGLSQGQTMIKINLPQAIRIVIPSLVNQFIITYKDTSIMSVIGFRELILSGRVIIAVNFESFFFYTIIAIMYLISLTLLAKISRRIERNLSYGKG